MDKKEIAGNTIRYIERQIQCACKALSLDEVAEKIGYSKFYLNRVFQEAVGTTIHQYILERRLTEAAKKLVYSDEAVVDIAYDAGYQSQQAFTHVFGSIFHCTPMKYRADRQYVPLRMPHRLQGIRCQYPKMEAAA